MCLIVIANRCHPDYPLILAANRDEFYERPTHPMSRWPDAPDVIAGRDERGGGTWLGMTISGRLAAVTNYRDARRHLPDARSRGELVKHFLTGADDPVDYLEATRQNQDAYNGFNLIAGTIDRLYCLSNRGGSVQRLPAGIVGLSNHLIDTPWPKVVTVKAAARRLIESGQIHRTDRWLECLSDTARPPDKDLPDTGVGPAIERMLSPVFIRTDGYGTRSSALITVHVSGRVRFVEKTHAVGGTPEGMAAQTWQIPQRAADQPAKTR
ncbi:MAG: NRDE family protein [Desulfobacterales bacterium]|jgi:uncharacterized protein with NRDE domain